MSNSKKNKVKYKCRVSLDSLTQGEHVQVNNFKDAVIRAKSSKSNSFEDAWPELVRRNSPRGERKSKDPKNVDWVVPLKVPFQRSDSFQNELKLTFSNQVPKKVVNEVHTTPGDDCYDFPTLEDSVRNKTHFRKPVKTHSMITQPDVPTYLPSTSAFSKRCKEKEKKKLRTKPHTKDPVNINVFEAIQFAAAKRLKTKEVRAIEKVTYRLQCGNMLDSSRPIRKKGKNRLTPKRKPISRIKNAIVLARALRQRRKVLNSSDDSELALTIENLQEKIDKATIELNKTFCKVKCLPSLHDRNGENKYPKSLNASKGSETQKNLIHSRKFRSYCNNIKSKALESCVGKLLNALFSYQDRIYKTEPINFKKKRRYVCGFKETIKYLQFGDLKLIIVATNLEICEGDPLINIIQDIIKIANENNVPCAFVGTSQDLGYWTLKKSRISIIGLLNYMGAEDIFKDVIFHLEKAKSDYKEKLKLTEEIQSVCDKENSTQEGKGVEELIKETMLLKLACNDS